ncbi:KamA family radical SAM protein [Suttonella sp. R2A3]|uniref:KamA family radical SAM protein n=1 Tax=Suttonella sp. R2A3 TaxID=2908648 RepID=UPI001F28E7F9|nr:KamA family radical SAM protein [Suttonella sp. R2A3]UJF24393.1 KamA family radical SAM protein [Suttonella sp. R2A3]
MSDKQAKLNAVLAQYQSAVTSTMRTQMHNADPTQDPLAAQFMPDVRELNVCETELSDPIGDEAHSPLNGLVHRYPNRVLWTMAPTCAVYCRFCFRKEHIGRKGHALTREEREATLAYIAADTGIEEVILSGGDPLHLPLAQLRKFLEPLNTIGHIRRVRIHTRIPVVDPQRVNTDLLELLGWLTPRVVVVLHINHINELSEEAVRVINALRAADVMLCSQTVLLRGVNVDLESLAALFNGLLDVGVMPYYLHHLDLARGTQHFRLSLDEGLTLYRALRATLSGIAVPRYIVEIPGGGGKVPVTDLTASQRAQLKLAGIF